MAICPNCPQCGTPLRLSWHGINLRIRCKDCDAYLKPIYCAEHGLVLYAGFGLCVTLFQLLNRLTLIREHYFLFVIVWIYAIGFVLSRIDRICIRGAMAIEKNVADNQFSLVQAVYAAIFAAVMIGLFLRPPEEHEGLALGGYVLVGLIEVARYVSIRRSRGRIE